MKRTITIVLALSTVFFIACQKAPELTITSPGSIELSADGSSGSITFTANRDWSVSCQDSWITVSPSSGSASDGSVTVTVRCNANTTYEDRTATVTIRMEELSQKVTVRQPANLGIILPSQAYNLTSDARSIEVEVKANVEYTVEVSADWIRQTGTKALTSKTLAFSIEENQTYDAREGKITIKSNNPSVQDQVITVKQAQKDAIIVKDTSFDMPYGGGEIEFKMEANVAFDVKTDADWLHYVSTKALSTSTVKLKIDENATFSARSGKVDVTQQGGSLKHTITVNQALDQLIREGYCIRRPKKGTYVRDPHTARMNSKGGTIILYSVHQNSEMDLVDSSFYTHLHQIAEQSSVPVNLLIISGIHSNEQLKKQLDELRNMIGVIFVGIHDLSTVLSFAEKYPDCRFVLLNYQYPNFEILAPSNLKGVFNDEFNGGYAAASELLARGCRRFGAIQYEVSNENYHLRMAGVRQACRDHGFPLNEQLIRNVKIDIPPMDLGYYGVIDLLEQEPRLDGLFCINDIIAAGASRYLAAEGNGRTLEIIGYDNHIPELHKVNRFSTIEINTRSMAAAAVRMLTDPRDYPCKTLLIPPHLIK